MSVTLVNPSLDRAGRGGGRTAFERNILPEFARWVIAQIEASRPDYLVPAETKGARILEAVLRYAREELGTPITVPVLYGTALAYLDPDELASKRLMLVDDAVRTGGNIAYHRWRARSYGAKEITAIACIGAGDGARRDVDCFLVVGEDLYREYVWQLTELVVARGLPPEVDHHIYEVRLPQRLTSCWEMLARLLSGYGTLTIDGPAERREELLGMTLHFPRLPGRPAAAFLDDFRAVDKLRFFPDLDHDCVYAVPVVFPPLCVPGNEENRPILPDKALELVPDDLAASGGVGDLLIDHARTLNAKTLFRAASTAAEVDCLTSFASLLAGAFPGASVSAHPDSFARLYGEECGKVVAGRVAALINAAMAHPAAVSADGSSGGGEAQRTYLDRRVVETTRRIVDHLRGLYRRGREEGRDASERIGLSVPEICAAFPDEPALLVSRCIDYGMAMTALVPFIGFECGDGAATVERRYRVSEPLRGEEELAYEDVGDARVELSEQTVAVIAHNVIERSGPEVCSADPELLAALIAILRPLVLESHSIPLKVVPGKEGPEILLADDEQRIGIYDKISSFFDYDLNSKGYVPTPDFLGPYREGTLPVEVRKSVEDIESRLEMLLPFLDDLKPAERDQLLSGWKMSTDHRLGLTFVRDALESALLELAASLRMVKRGRRHDHDVGLADAASERTQSAAANLEVLGGDWQRPAVDRWSERLALERHFRDSLACPEKPLDFYALSEVLTDLTAELGILTERLSAASAGLWSDSCSAERAIEVAQLAVDLSARARRVLHSFDDTAPDVPDMAVRDPRDALAFAAARLEDTIKVVRALLAACAGAYRGPEDAHLRKPPHARRHAAVLSLDIAGSRAHEHRHPRGHDAWKNQGLNMAAQWARALGGWEGRNRFGDDLLIEFESGDSAALCGALVQCHAEALRSTGIDAISRRFHAGLDCGQIVSQTGGSTDGPCMDRVCFIAEECEDGSPTTDVYLTPEAWAFCSKAMQTESIQLDGWNKRISLDHGQTQLRPVAIDSHALLRRYTACLIGLSREIAGRLAGQAALAKQIDIGPIEESDVDAATRSIG